MYDKTIILDLNQSLSKDYQPQPSALAENCYLHLDYTGHLKNLIQ